MASDGWYYSETVFRAWVVIASPGCPAPDAGEPSAAAARATPTFEAPVLVMAGSRRRPPGLVRGLAAGTLLFALAVGGAWRTTRKRLGREGEPLPPHSNADTASAPGEAPRGPVSKQAATAGVLGKVA